ncbi:hypothetical protein IFM89_009325 [Coptis chinensis]|uniref:RNase H type-1 domain-containing protein n=1 Tax=Coptis chinensis TaxID=261450 RepID=A0A835INH6_9MAGN|nr:hypothetical protein IFM89_009325 [Coptis chinensis]
MYQELKAIEQGLHKCKDLLVTKLVVVSDSLRAINALNSAENAPWETNRAADYLASLTTDVNDECTFIPPLDLK